MKKFQKAFAIITTLALMMTGWGNLSACALNTTTNPDYLDDGISTYDNSIPSSTWNLSTKGIYYFSGNGTGQANIYTLYNFTGVSRLDMTVINTGDTSIKVRVRKNSLIDTTVTTFTVSAGDTVVKSVDVDKDNKYYLSFSSPCDFEGWIL